MTNDRRVLWQIYGYLQAADKQGKYTALTRLQNMLGTYLNETLTGEERMIS